MVFCLMLTWDDHTARLLDLQATTMAVESEFANATTSAADSSSMKSSSSEKAASTDNHQQDSQVVLSGPSLWKKLGKDMKLDHSVDRAQVQREIKRIIANKKKFYKILKDSTPYIYYIYQQTEARNLPAEIALIPIIESEFNPNDHSDKGALGLWQLMPVTAKELGVKDKSGYDGRRNVVASTNGALSYFKDLGSEFKNNWYLAVAAYNCGQGKVESLERRTGSENFWSLPLPTETRYYVPRLMAIAEVMKNPGKYGVTLPPVVNKPYFSEFKVKKPVSLTTLAKNHDISLETLTKLNPDYKHGVQPKKGTYTLLVPAAKTTDVKEALKDKVVAVKTGSQLTKA